MSGGAQKNFSDLMPKIKVTRDHKQVQAQAISSDVAIYKDSLKKHTYVAIINDIPNCRIFCICLSFECALPLSKEILTGATAVNRLRTKFSIDLHQ